MIDRANPCIIRIYCYCINSTSVLKREKYNKKPPKPHSAESNDSYYFSYMLRTLWPVNLLKSWNHPVLVVRINAREVQSTLASKPTPPGELRIPREQNGGLKGDQYTPPECFRCGQVGHIQRGCRNIPQTLPSENANTSLTRGYQGQNARRPRPNTQNSGQSHWLELRMSVLVQLTVAHVSHSWTQEVKSLQYQNHFTRNIWVTV